MPRAAAGSAGGKGKGPKGKAHKLAERFPSGEILLQAQPAKKKWQLLDVVGQGGFGMIYTASDVTDGPSTADPSYVIKIEPLDNGPLFCEFHFYQRVAKPELIAEWSQLKKQRYLAVPQFFGSGQHKKSDRQYRYLVLQRLSSDLQKLFEQNGRSFSEKTAFSVGLRMLDALEYIHDKSYCHADIKASNILLGYHNKKTDHNQVFLVDYGLAYKYIIDGTHKPYKEDPKRAHDGTCEYTSRDAHKGVCPSRRGDLEILGYCMLEWLAGSLPWNSCLNNKDKVKDLKIQYMNDLPSLYKICFGSKPCPEGLKKYLSVVSKLAYDEKPDYHQLRQFLRSSVSNEWTLGLDTTDAAPARKGVKRKSETAPPTTPKVLKTRPGTSPRTGTPRKASGSRSASTVSNGSTSKASKPRPKPRTPKTKAAQCSGTPAPDPSAAGPSSADAEPSTADAEPSTADAEPSTIIPGATKGRKGKPARVTRVVKSPAAKIKSLAAKIKSPAVKAKPGAKSPAAAKRKARTPQKAAGPIKRKRKAVESTEMAVQTSPGFVLQANGNPPS